MNYSKNDILNLTQQNLVNPQQRPSYERQLSRAPRKVTAFELRKNDNIKYHKDYVI